MQNRNEYSGKCSSTLNQTMREKQGIRENNPTCRHSVTLVNLDVFGHCLLPIKSWWIILFCKTFRSFIFWNPMSIFQICVTQCSNRQIIHNWILPHLLLLIWHFVFQASCYSKYSHILVDEWEQQHSLWTLGFQWYKLYVTQDILIFQDLYSMFIVMV